MLHGFTSTPHQFKELSQYLAEKGFTVYAPLIAGHGTHPKDLIKTSAEDWKKSVKDAYFKLKEKTEKIVLVGNSFGGNLAFWLAKDLNNEPIAIISLGTPIFLKYQWIIKMRVFFYGWLRKYYRKPPRVYKADSIDMIDEVTYPLIPIKSLRDFLNFIKNETMTDLNKVKVPAFVAHSDVDPVVQSKSAAYIYENLNSYYKKIYWFDSSCHVMTNDKSHSFELFLKISDFINEIKANNFKSN